MEDLAGRLRALRASLERAIAVAKETRASNAALLETIEEEALAILATRQPPAPSPAARALGQNDPIGRMLGGVVLAVRYAAQAPVSRGIEALWRAREAVDRCSDAC